MADTRDLKSLALKGVRVRVSLAAPKQGILKRISCFFVKAAAFFCFTDRFFISVPGAVFCIKYGMPQ